jgi:hypothetical protein
MPAIEVYLESAGRLAQEVVNDWGTNMRAGNASALSEDFVALNEYACRYMNARDLADNHRKFSGLTEEDAAHEAETRQAFAEAYKRYWERKARSSTAATKP